MDNTQSLATLLESTTSKIQQLQKAFAELESHRAVTLNLKWKQIEDHFHGLEKSLKRRFTVLENQEKEFDTKTVQSQKVLENRQAAILAKEEASLEKLQEKRDAAVAAISYALGKHNNDNQDCAGFFKEQHDADQDCAGIFKEQHDADQDCAGIFKEQHDADQDCAGFFKAQHDATKHKCSTHNTKILTENDMKMLSNPHLATLCKDMDSGGLHKYISDNRKNLASIKEDIPAALRAAVDPGGLVLDSLHGFYVSETFAFNSKKDSNLLGLRRTCIMLMESLSIMLTNLDAKNVCKVISNDVKARAKVIAEEWKTKLNNLDVDAGNGNSLEAHAFLQLVATFNIDSEFLRDDLSKLIPMVSRRRQTADLCRFLGLSEKMPGVLDVLVNSGRHIDAVNLAFAFELTGQFSPVLLLKSYLIEARRQGSPSMQNDASEKELSALKAIIKCVEDHKLEDQYPLDPLQKRLFQLEKTKANRKQTTEVSKPQHKRPRANAIAGHTPRNPINTPDKNFHTRTTDRYSPPKQYVYDHCPYGYPGPADHHVPPFVGGGTYNIAPNHGNYFGIGYQYQTHYIH